VLLVNNLGLARLAAKSVLEARYLKLRNSLRHKLA
jgi:hypothetical protein